jgi:hypothetical protein
MYNFPVLSMKKIHRKNRRLAFSLAALQMFIGLGAVVGGVGLISAPDGANLRMPVECLSDSPFSDFLIPGIVLLVVNGFGSITGGVLSFRHHLYAGQIAVGLGAFLMMWIVAQIWWIGLVHWLQPLYFALGVLELVLGSLLWRSLRTVK